MTKQRSLTGRLTELIRNKPVSDLDLKMAHLHLVDGVLSMMAGRSVSAKKRLIRLLFDRVGEQLGIAKADIEISINESPAHNWGFRGMSGDEIQLNYKVEV